MCEMTILNVLFEAIAVDIVDPFPRGRSGHQYVLTIVC